jgi:flagellin-like protein
MKSICFGGNGLQNCFCSDFAEFWDSTILCSITILYEVLYSCLFECSNGEKAFNIVHTPSLKRKEKKEMLSTKNLSRRLRRSKRAISPIIAVLLIIVITVAASLVAYAWIMGYIGDISSSAGDAIQIQSIARTEAGEITAYVQNVGQSDVYITNAYLDDVYDPDAQAYPEMVATPLPYRLNTTTTVPIVLSLTSLNDAVKVKIVTSEGTFMELTKKFTSSTGGGGGTITPTVVYYKPIDIVDAQVAGSSHPDFPMLITVSGDSDIGGRISGSDNVYFTLNDGTTLLPHEFESFSLVGGAASFAAWVKVPSLTPTTVLRVCYGAGVSRPVANNPENVWNSNYKGVWHLEESGTGALDEYVDSTSNNNDGQGGNGAAGSTPARVSGQIGFAQDFSSDFINVGTDTSLKIQNTVTLEAWVKMDSTGMGCIICRQLGTDVGDGYVMFQNSGSYRASFFIFGCSRPLSSTISPNTSWHHWVVTATAGSNNLKIYIDGQPSGSTGTVATYPTLDDNPVIIGGGENGSGSTVTELFDGSIDEVHISSTILSPQWIQTEYNNQNNPTGFYNIGTEATA